MSSRWTLAIVRRSLSVVVAVPLFLFVQIACVGFGTAGGGEIVVQGSTRAGSCRPSFSPNGQRLACGEMDGTIVLWDIPSGAIFRRIAGHGVDLRVIAFARGGHELFCLDYAGRVAVWDVATGRCIQSIFAPPHGASSAAITPDGSRIVTCREGQLHVWDTKSGALLRRLSKRGIKIGCVAFSPDGKFIWSGADEGSVTVWDSQSGEPMHSEKITFPESRRGSISAIAVSPDGKVAAARWAECPPEPRAGAGFGFFAVVADVPPVRPPRVVLWDAHNYHRAGEFDVGRRVDTFDPVWPEDSLGVHWGAKRLIADGHFWDVDTHKSIDVFKRLNITPPSVMVCFPQPVPNGITSVALSDDGRRLAVGVHIADDSAEEIRIINLADWRSLRVLRAQALSFVSSVAASPDGKKLLLATDHLLAPIMLDSANPCPYHAFGENLDGFVGSVTWSCDGKFFAIGKQEALIVWDAATRRRLFRIWRLGGVLYGVTFSADGSLIAGRPPMGTTVDVRNASTGELFGKCENVVKHREAPAVHGFGDSEVHAIAWSPRGRVLAAANDNMVILHDVDHGRELRRLDGGTHQLISLIFSPDGKTIAAGTATGHVLLWSLDEGRQLLPLALGGGRVTSLQFSKDGTVLIAGTSFQTDKEGRISSAADSIDRRVTAWDWKTRRLLRTFPVDSYVNSVTLLSGDRLLVTVSDDCAVKIWDFQSGSLAAILHTFKSNQDWLIFTPGGFYDGSDGAPEKYVRFRDPHDPAKVVLPNQGFADYYHPGLLKDILEHRAVLPPRHTDLGKGSGVKQ